MSQRVNRRELIMEITTQLFQEQGYAATSTRQIAEDVGCTEAALYYHFKEGEKELLRAVIDSRLPEMETVLDQCCDATSLKEALLLFSDGLAQRSAKMRWVLAELPHLDPEEQEIVIEKYMFLRDGLSSIIASFVEDDSLAKHLAWTIVCLGVGYAQLASNPAFYERWMLRPKICCKRWWR